MTTNININGTDIIKTSFENDWGLEALLSVVEQIAALYSGEAIKGDPTVLTITGHEVYLAQQALKQCTRDRGQG